MNKKIDAPYHVSFAIRHPERDAYEEFCRTSNRQPIPYPDLILSFPMVRLPDPGDVVSVSRDGIEYRCRVKDRIFFVSEGPDDGRTNVKLEYSELTKKEITK